MAVAMDLGPEWERIDLLGACLSIHRSGGNIDEEMKGRLGQLQEAVNELRQSPPWAGISQQFQLDALDQDILACTLAPEAEPRLGWMYQELQPGLGSAYPTPALIREILFLQADESRSLQQRLQSGSPLQRSGLLQAGEAESFQALRPSDRRAVSRSRSPPAGTTWSCRPPASAPWRRCCCGSPNASGW